MYSDFVDQNGNAVSAATVLAAIKSPIIKHHTILSIFAAADLQFPFTFLYEDDFIRETFTITNSCASDGIKLGSVTIGMMKIMVKNNKLQDIDTPEKLIGSRIGIHYYLEIDENTTVTVAGGVYYVKEVEQLTEGVKLTCYDGMCKLDAPFTEATLSGTPYQILTQAATACGVTVQSTQAEIEALPNGTRTFTLHSDNDCKTWRDVLSYLSMLMGCFTTFGRNPSGVSMPGIEIRPFGNGRDSFCDTVTDVHRYKGAKFSIFDTAYAEFTLQSYALEDPNDPDSAKKMDFTYNDATVSTEGQTYELGYNPFLQPTTPEAGLTTDQTAILHDLLAKVATYQYTPMQISLPVGFIYDLGDVIKCTGRLANTGFAGGATDDAYGVILNETYTYGREYRIKSLDSHAGKGRTVTFAATLNVTVIDGTGATVTATDGTHTYTATESGGSATMTIGAAGTYTVTATLNGQTGSITDEVTISAHGGIYTAEVGFEETAHVYGVRWKNSWASSLLQRTDDAANFNDPEAYIAGSTSYGSPFDNLMPWAGIERVTDSAAGELVKIPKFWYKLSISSLTGLQLKIADREADGFYTAPAFMDRGDGEGERDFVYVARYHCSSTDYKSSTGVKPIINITRDTARQNIKAIGSGIWQWDYAMLVTIWMLYLVEYANWDSQAVIGGGCRASIDAQYGLFDTGGTDSMPYHTGNTETAHGAYGNCQYRYIENLWGNCCDWVDGIYIASDKVCAIKNPSDFSDSVGGVQIRSKPTKSGYIVNYAKSSKSGFTWLIYPSSISQDLGSEDYISDWYYVNASDPAALYMGGNYQSSSPYSGLFRLDEEAVSTKRTWVGSRLMYLP